MKKYNNNKTTYNKKIYYDLTYYPNKIKESIDDIYIITNDGDRLDLLSEQFYGDSSMYFIISLANPDVISFDSLYVPQGTQLRIPKNINEVISDIKTNNI
jgi:hypothetical protein